MPRSITKVVTPKMTREGGGFMVRRVLGGTASSCDPFLMLDHFGPVDHGPGEAIGAPDHPHRGFETVTYIIDGESQHKDSQGNTGVLGPGWVQWMTAGSGVVHSEMPTEKMQKYGGRMEGFQLWVNLPAEDKMIPPRYQDTPPDKIPVVESRDKKVRVKVIAGESMGTKAYIDTRTPIMYLDISLEPFASFSQTVPDSFDGFVYVWRGSGKIGGREIGLYQLGFLGAGSNLDITADKDGCRLSLIAGQPLKEPVVWHGPFVMNTREQIEQAISDYHSGKLGKIDGMEERMKQTEQAKQKQKQSGTWDKR
ncbi:pirin-like protein CC_0481 [Ruditapes philippinarum]|uniref:pirin-like protein CC_0481 n=1 Tax=Ruditapes philippinarum TaxID=129788 RepID=UPI00295B1DB4|nr:pirin-like protein CC_0481 [Ruditapes philippinarum]